MNPDRRTALAGLGSAALGSGLAFALAPRAVRAEGGIVSASWIDLKRDFHAVGDGKADDTAALEAAIRSGAEAQRPIFLPTGVYSISRALQIPSNTMLIGSAPGLGFGCRIEPVGCPAFIIGGSRESFHCVIENLMIWPRGAAPDFIVSIDNSYSIAFRNLRIHEAQPKLRRAAIVLMGSASAGGHGRCNNVIWDNLIVRNDVEQPPIAVLAAAGCGSHRFLGPCLENYQVLLDWRGGQIDWVLPYTERAGRYGVDCNLDASDEAAYFSTFGGSVDCAASGLACAIRASTRNFNSFGTRWAQSGEHAVHFYDLPAHAPSFHGIVPNLGDKGKARFSGVPGWRRFANFPGSTFSVAHEGSIQVPANGTASMTVQVDQVRPKQHWVRIDFAGDGRDAHLTGFVSDVSTVTIVVRNLCSADIKLSGSFQITCGTA